MPARHDEWGMIPESQKKAADKYQKQNIQQLIVKLNIKTDADIIRFLWSVSNKQGLIKRLLREEMERQKAGASADED